MYNSYRLNKLSRFNKLVALNSNIKFRTKTNTKPVISKESMSEPSTFFKHECSEEKNPGDKSIENKVSLIRDRLFPVLDISPKENNVILVWNIFDEISQQNLNKQDPIFECIKEYEIFGQKKIYKQEISNSSDTLEILDKSKWLSVNILYFSYFFIKLFILSLPKSKVIQL